MMVVNKIFTFYSAGILTLLSSSCIQEIPFENESFESALVISATITNENKLQEIFISRTYRFEDDGPNPERNANIVVFGNGVEYNFGETDAGKYVSEFAFGAQPNVDYHLQITTAGGRIYNSTPTQLTATTQIDALYPVRETNDDGVNGMTMYIDSYDPSGNSKYYRYEYEETFKIVAPDYVEQDAIVINDVYPFCEVGLTKRSPDQKVCYRTEISNNINLTTTETLNEDRVSRFPVRFLSSEDYKISYRYSILVKQYVQSPEAYKYLETISSFSEEGSLFSQFQPGFITGNITSEGNTSEKVLGFFEVSSVDMRRIYFNYEDFYPNSLIPPYVISCQFVAPRLFAPSHQEKCGSLIRIVRIRSLVYLEDNNGEIPHPWGGPFLMIPPACGDCTVLGSHIPPEFWEE